MDNLRKRKSNTEDQKKKKKKWMWDIVVHRIGYREVVCLLLEPEVVPHRNLLFRVKKINREVVPLEDAIAMAKKEVKGGNLVP